MTNAAEERNIFWSLFDEFLKKNGEPFKIIHERVNGEQTSWANVNKFNFMNSVCIDLSFLLREGLFRINFYIHEGENCKVGQKFLKYKDLIEEMLSVKLRWENGKNNKTTMRPSYYLSFKQRNIESYKDLIEKSYPIILEFINVAKFIDKDAFFDF